MDVFLHAPGGLQLVDSQPDESARVWQRGPYYLYQDIRFPASGSCHFLGTSMTKSVCMNIRGEASQTQANCEAEQTLI